MNFTTMFSESYTHAEIFIGPGTGPQMLLILLLLLGGGGRRSLKKP